MERASYACNPDETLGRAYKEVFEGIKDPYLKDRDKVISSVAFRRLEYKTQVFINCIGDHYRTRLTHTLEVAQIARIAAHELSLNEDLAETIALCHDLGHPPFGHAGEDGLKQAAENFGGFNHNIQTVRIITATEQRYAGYDGLNLTWETVEGVLKHNGPLLSQNQDSFITKLDAGFNLLLDQQPSLEAQIASLADDIAYCNHDIDDGIRAGMFDLEDLYNLDSIKEIAEGVKTLYPRASKPQILNETIRRLNRHMIFDLVYESKKNINFLQIKTVRDVREQKKFVITFSKETESMKNQLKDFLMERVYRHYTVNRIANKAIRIVKNLFTFFMENQNCLPIEWQKKLKGLDDMQQAVIIKDYISGMTDRYAIDEHKRLFSLEYFTNDM